MHNLIEKERKRERKKERERKLEGRSGVGKVILLCRQTTFTHRRETHDRESLRGRYGDAYNLALAQKEWASPGSKLTVIDRAGWFYWPCVAGDRLFVRSFFVLYVKARARGETKTDRRKRSAKRSMRRCEKFVFFFLSFFVYLCKWEKERSEKRAMKERERDRSKCDCCFAMIARDAARDRAAQCSPRKWKKSSSGRTRRAREREIGQLLIGPSPWYASLFLLFFFTSESSRDNRALRVPPRIRSRAEGDEIGTIVRETDLPSHGRACRRSLANLVFPFFFVGFFKNEKQSLLERVVL